MSLGLIFSLLAGAAAGGFINGLAGFGTALFALGIWLQVLPPWQAISIAVIMSIVSGLQGVWVVRHDLKNGTGRMTRFLVPALAGVPLGAAVPALISATALRTMIAGFMVLYGSFFALRRSLPQFDRATPTVDILVGFCGGILGGAASLSGALPTMWCAMRPWTKSETRAVLQPFNIVTLMIAAALFAWRGYYTHETLLLTAIALPITLISAQIGITVFHRLTDNQFRRLLIWLLFISGVALALREFA